MKFESVVKLAIENLFQVYEMQNCNNSFRYVKSVNENCDESLSYLSSKRHLVREIEELRGIVILEENCFQKYELEKMQCSYLVVSNAKYLFALLFRHSRSNGELLSIESISQNLNLFFNKIAVSFSRLSRKCRISKGCKLHSNVRIGKDVIIECNSVIGGMGFGYATRLGFPPIRMPHLGAVLIGNRVEIGSCTNIDRGSFGNTVIEDDVKIDNGVHIAHNVYVGARTLIAANAEISGSVVIGSDCWIAPNVSIREKVVIGEGSLVGIGSVVTKDVPPFTIVYGSPAKPKAI